MSESDAASRPVLRFAPSPNGRLHRGHALSALTNLAFADRLGGRLLLRIEDIDPQRCRPEFEAAILADLAWLGIAFDGPVLRQSQRMEAYGEALGRLRRRGLLYPCFCSRAAILAETRRLSEERGAPWPSDPDGAPLYPGTCRDGDPDRPRSGGPHLWRLRMADAIEADGRDGLAYTLFDAQGAESTVLARPERWGDVVLARRDVPTSYHLAVVVDDAAQGVTHVVRGRDLEAATDIHVLLQRLLGLPTPRYHFHPLLRDEAGRKLSKSLASQSLAELREAGVAAEVIRAELGFA